MDHHFNPWSSVPSERPYVPECDRDSVAEYNAKCRAEKYRLRTDVLPEPFIGRIEAPVLLLNLNPGFSDENVVEHARPEFQALLRNNYSQVPSAFPFYYLDPTIESLGGAKWWSRKLKELIDACGGPRKVVNGLLGGFCVSSTSHIILAAFVKERSCRLSNTCPQSPLPAGP